MCAHKYVVITFTLTNTHTHTHTHGLLNYNRRGGKGERKTTTMKYLTYKTAPPNMLFTKKSTYHTTPYDPPRNEQQAGIVPASINVPKPMHF